MSEFSGKGDPEDHCEKYELLMIGMGHNDIMLCKMFKTYLKGSTSMWYKYLKPRSIESYEQLKKKMSLTLIRIPGGKGRRNPSHLTQTRSSMDPASGLIA